MTTPARPFPRRRSVGAFLCVHSTTPPVEDIDRPSLLDIKQDAALGAWLSLRRLGKDTGPDPVAAFDAEPRLAWLAYRWAYQEAQRRRRGYGQRPRPVFARLWLDTPRDDPLDPAQEATLDALVDDHAAEIMHLWHDGIPGLTRDQTRRVLRLMRLVQVLKAHGVARVPDPIRKRLWKLRRETGLPLDTSLL